MIYNRLKNDIRLDIDATTRFAVGNWNRPLKVSELQNPSLYNTRVHSGLPPGPIGSPGLRSIQAAAHPAKTGFIFYVAAVCGNGKHKFAETDAEFQRYVAEYDARSRRARRQVADGLLIGALRRPRLPGCPQPLAGHDERGVRRARHGLALRAPADRARAVRGDGARPARAAATGEPT